MSTIRRMLVPFMLVGLVVLAGCGPEEGGSDGPVALQGHGQKGPFEPSGASAAAYALESDGRDGNEFSTASIKEGGAFSFGEFDWTGPTRVVVEGSYYDEVSGDYGDDRRTLQMIVDVGEEEIAGNVNFFTHLHAARTIYLMGEGYEYTEADDEAEDDLWWVTDTESDARELDIFRGIENTDGDDRRLLEFSVALLTTEMTQEEIDAITSDFADDGDIDGDGEELFLELEDAMDESDFAQAMDTASQNLRAEFPAQMPDDDDEGDDETDLEPDCRGGERVVCPGDVGEDTIAPTSTEDWEVYATFPGSYVIAVTFEESSRFNAWTLYEESDFSGEIGSQIEGSVVEGPTDVPLSGETSFYLRVENGTSDPNPAKVTLTRVSDGRDNEPVEFLVEQPFQGTAGNNNQVKNFTSYYAFETEGAGMHSVTFGDYGCGGSTQGLRAKLIEADSAAEAFADGTTSLAMGSSDGECSLELEADLAPATTYYLEVTNMNFRSLSGASGESYTILVSEQ